MSSADRSRRPLRQALCTAGGFTLVEVLVVIAIIGVVGIAAAPTFNRMMISMSARSAAQDLISDLALARSEATKRNAEVDVTPAGGDWANGWTVEVDGTTLASRGAVPSSLSIDAPSAGVTFLPSGRVSGMAATTRWSIEPQQSGVTGRCVIITPTGAARSKVEAC